MNKSRYLLTLHVCKYSHIVQKDARFLGYLRLVEAVLDTPQILDSVHYSIWPSLASSRHQTQSPTSC